MPKLCFQLLLPQVHHGGSGHPGVAELLGDRTDDVKMISFDLEKQIELLGPRSLHAFPVESFFMEPTPQPSSTNGSIHQGSKAAPPNKNQKCCGWCYCSDP